MTQAELASHVPGLTATIDELFAFVALVRECLAEHDAANGLLTGVKQPDGPITARVRAALEALPQPPAWPPGLSASVDRLADRHVDCDCSQCLPPTF